MNNRTAIALFFSLALVILSCSKDDAGSKGLAPGKNGSLQRSTGSEQISGNSTLAGEGQCTDMTGATFTLSMTGDLTGCVYTYVDAFDCSPSGAYKESGREFFVGTFHGQYGTFETKYSFEGKYEGCPLSGEPLGLEIFGRCQHPIVKGSGTGVFEGATGRLSFKDNVVLLIYPYEGHIRY